MCTCLIAGKNASASGKAILAANDDWDGVAGVLSHVKRAVHAEGEVRVLTGGQEIPEALETYGFSYTACDYSIGTLTKAWAGGMNDRGVAVAGTGVDAYKPLPYKGLGYLLEPDDIPLLILERGESAGQAVRMICDLILAYGLRPSEPEGSAGTSAATFSIADGSEGWVLEVVPGRCFVAVRVPDDQVSVRVNAFGTHDADLTDAENVIASPGLADYADSLGFWEGDERHFDFAGAFGADTSPTEWGPEGDPMNMRRRWRAMSLFSGRELAEDEPLYMVRPSNKVSPEDMMRVLSDIYEGTAYDLTKTEAAGPYGDPFAEGMPSYALCRRGTVASIVTEAGDRPEEAVLWVAPGTPRMVPYVPVYADIEDLPSYTSSTKPCSEGLPSFYYEMKTLCMLTEYRYDRLYPITAEGKLRYEERMREALREEKAADALDTGMAGRLRRTGYTEKHLALARGLCAELCGKLLRMY